MTPPEMLAGVRVLVIDDNRTNRRILEGLLKSWGMEPTVVPGAEEALAALDGCNENGHSFQLIVTDMHMPKMDGFGLVEKIKESGGSATATIMMLTSGGHRGDAARCQQLGIAAYLLKPVRKSGITRGNCQGTWSQRPESRHPTNNDHSRFPARGT